jgi:uncharacterized coiled-coil protein SlyX
VNEKLKEMAEKAISENRLRADNAVADLQRSLADVNERLKGMAEKATVFRVQDMLAGTQEHVRTLEMESTSATTTTQGIHAQLRSFESRYAMHAQTISGLQEQLSNIGTAESQRMQGMQAQARSLESRIEIKTTTQADRIAHMESQLGSFESKYARQAQIIASLPEQLSQIGTADAQRTQGMQVRFDPRMGNKRASQSDCIARIDSRNPASRPTQSFDSGSLTVLESQLGNLERTVKEQRVRVKEAFAAITELRSKTNNLQENHYITMDEFQEFCSGVSIAMENLQKEKDLGDGNYVTVDEFYEVCHAMTGKVKEHGLVIAHVKEKVQRASMMAEASNVKGLQTLQDAS